MKNLFTMLFLALDFAPGYKRAVGAAILAASAVAVAYNNFLAPQFGLPAVPGELIEGATVTGNAVLGVGVASAAVRA